MDGHRVERADEDDPKAASKSWPSGHKPRTPVYNVPWSCAQREVGNVPRKRGTGGPPQELQWAAEDELISKAHDEFQCQLPSTARSTFLMVFSPDGTKVASTHGDHNVYVTDLPSGKGVRKLSGHPRTPWCLAFHPSSNQILASGCLGGQVRVWDLHGGSELWTAESHTVIASLAFHPTDRMLVVATYNELHFWDWSQPVPFAKCFTASEKEKVRYVTFDPLGHKLITGIANRTFVQSQWDRIPVSMSNTPSSPVVTTSSTTPSSSSVPSTSSSSSASRPQPSSSPPFQAGRATAASSSASNVPDQERRITVCYRSLVEQYEQLVQRYYDLSRAQAAASAARVAARGGVPSTSGAASFASTTDRGTDPMEQESASTAPPPTTSNDDRFSNLSADNPSSSARLDSLRANLRRFRQPSFLSMTGFQRRILRTAASRLTHQVEDVSDRVDDEISGGQSRRVVAQGELMVRMVSSPCPDRLTVRLRSVSAVTVPSTSATPTPTTTTTSAPSNTSTPTTNARPFASVRSAFRPRLASSRASDQAALDLRVRSCQSTTGSTSTVSTFSTSLRSAFQPRTSTTRSGNSATRGSSSGRQGSRFSSPPADVSVRFGIQLLSRHIDNMQRLCRARLEILQLQQIRRMWEDLQRQIGSLHAAVRDGNSSAMPSSPTASSLFPNSPPASTTSPPSSPPPRPSRPPLPPSPPPLPPPPLSSPSSGEDDGGEPSGGGVSRPEDEEEGLRVRELMELARISGGEEPEGAGSRGGDGSEEGASEVGGESGGVSSGMAGAPFRDRPGNQTSRKRARIPVRFPEPGPNRPLRLFARIATGTRPVNRGRPAGYSSLLGRLIARPQRRLPSLRVGRCGPPYVCLQRLPEGVVSAAVAAGQIRSDLERSDWQPETGMSNDVARDANTNNVSDEQNPGDASPDNSSNQDGAVAADPVSETREEESTPRVPDTSAADAEPSNTDAAPVPGPSSSPTSSQINSFRQAGEDFHGRFCSMISRLEVLVRQQRENREAYWRARRDALWTRREAGRPEGGGRGSSEANRGPSDCPIFTLSDSSSDESDSSNVASPLARRIQLLQQRHLRERQRRAWRRGMAVNEGGRLPSSVAPATSEPPSSSPPPSTSTQVPPSASSSIRDEPSTSSGAPSDAEWQWTRESTRLRARQVLSMMVESLTQFFEQHGLSQETPHAILDEQIYNLYVLLQLALELTDLLLIQLMSTRRELEEQWVNTLRGPNSEGNNAQDSSRRTTAAPSQATSSPSTSQLQGPRLFRALPRPFPRSRGTAEPDSSQPPSVDSTAGGSSEEPPSSRPRQSFTVPEVQVNDVPVAPEAVSLLGEPTGGRPRARSPPPPGGIFVPVGSPRSMPMSVTSTSSSRRGRPNPFVQLHQLRRLGGTGGAVGAGVGAGVGNGSGGTGEGRFRRFLHPRYVGPNPLGDEYREDPLQETMENILRGTFLQDSVVADASMSLTHRIQAWDFSSYTIPEIGDGEQNVVVPECKIHNDASVDVSSDGRMLVTLLPPGRLQINTMLGIYSLEWGNLGECLFIMSLAQNAVSVSLSPTCRHLAVGLASRRVALLPSDRHTMAQLFRLDSAPPYPSPPPSASSKGKGVGKGMRRGASNASGTTPNSSQVIGHLHHVRDIDQGRGQGYVSLNCIRWMPGAGQGLVYGTNTGQLKVLR